MFRKPQLLLLLALFFSTGAIGARIPQDYHKVLRSFGRDIVEVKPSNEDNALEITFIGVDSRPVVHGFLGYGFASVLPLWSEVENCTEFLCAQWGDFASLTMKSVLEDPENYCLRIEWSSSYARDLEDCFDLESDTHWYGGSEPWFQTWPINDNPRTEDPYTSDYGHGGVTERYWLLSNGASITVDPEVPLWHSLNTTRPDKVCYLARDQGPYTKRTPLTHSYEWCVSPNAKAAHQLTYLRGAMKKPRSLPDERMLVQPFFSTWAEYKVDVNQTNTLDYARKVLDFGFRNTSHIQIDDDWETCYGDQSWNPQKFPDPKAMVDEIKGMGGLNLRMTLWAHPFINYGCPMFQEGLEKGYLVKNTKDKLALTGWWQGETSGIIDFTNPDATQWFVERLQGIQRDTGMDAFKFDAGETSLLPAAGKYTGDEKYWPQVYTTKYVQACASFGGLVENRVAFLNQDEPMFIRMNDKDSNWGYENGLRTLIPATLQMSINGYPYVLPDMVGGNNYHGEVITQEFFIRWLQVNVFMPSVQFSLVPWRVGETEEERNETVRLSLETLAVREKYAAEILEAARQSVEDGTPMNRPLWWVDPEDHETFTIDDEYMLGDKILVAPITYEGQTSRDVYLPKGDWVDEASGVTRSGPGWLRDHPAPLNVVPIFVKSG